MTTKLIIDVKDLTPGWVSELQQRYEGAQLEIIIRESAGVQQMNEERFWAIIAQLDWTQGEHDEAILAPAVDMLKQFSVPDIQRFQDILAEKLYQLDTQAFAEQMGTYRYGGSNHFSVDTFLYARACVVANGRAFYQSVRNDPAKMPKEYTFEVLLYLAPTAYEQKTGERWDYLPRVSYETFSNREGWNGPQMISA